MPDDAMTMIEDQRVYWVICDNGHRGFISVDEWDEAPFSMWLVCPVCGAENPKWADPPADHPSEGEH